MEEFLEIKWLYALNPLNKSPLEFTHEYCNGCANEKCANDIKKVNQCLSCFKDQDKYFRAKQPVVIENRDGINIAEVLS